MMYFFMIEYSQRSIKHFKRKTSWDTTSALASFFLGIAFVLIVFIIFLMGFNLLLSFLISIILFLFFLMIVVLIIRPRKVVRVVKKQPNLDIKEEVTKEEPREKNFAGSSETKTYHKPSCRFAKLIKPQFRNYSDDEEFFKKRKYKACMVCMK